MNEVGIQLALLDGMDEDLLVRLHDAGVRTRAALAERTGTPEARRDLAARLGVPPLRIDALYYLNFLLPEERVARLVEAERRLSDSIESTRRAQRAMRRLVIGVGVALGAAVLLAAAFLRPSPPLDPAESEEVLALQLETMTLRERVDALQPFAEEKARADLADALARLGPAPGWRGPLTWTEDRHRGLALNLGEEPGTEPIRATSLALHLLGLVENAPPESLSVGERAALAARLIRDFPDPGKPTSLWDAAAASIRLRFLSRALGLAPLEQVEAAHFVRVPWDWTQPGFVQCELLLARVEALPLRADVLAAWSETLVALREAATAARDAVRGEPAAFARDYWIRRGELELAVAAALLGRTNVLPYAGESPAQFLAVRRSYLKRVYDQADPAARPALAWLLVEYEEARRLLAALAEQPALRAEVEGTRWLEAITLVEGRRAQPAAEGGGPLLDLVADALRASGSLELADPWTASRTGWEASLRPLLMETRWMRSAHRREAGSPGPGGAPPSSTGSR